MCGANRGAPSRRRQSGMGLVEVLVSVLVLSFGMLGLVGLQLSTLRNNQSSLERGMAVVQTHSIVDAMRADRANAISGGFNLDIDAAAPAGAGFAETALSAWRANLMAALGADTTGSVNCEDALCVITVRWNDARGTEGQSEQAITTEVQL